MDRVLDLTKINPTFKEKIKELSGQDVNLCYQCGKCTAGCPIANAVAPVPHQIIHLIQLGQEEAVLKAPTIWYCLSCITCTARCPKQLDLAKIMDAVREIVCKYKTPGKFPRIKLFEKLFLDSIRNNGRLFELGTVMRFNLQSGAPFHDIELMQPLLSKGKLGFRPAGSKDTKKIEEIFEKASKD